MTGEWVRNGDRGAGSAPRRRPRSLLTALEAFCARMAAAGLSLVLVAVLRAAGLR